MSARRALITGQDGPYLAELLLDEGYKVFGLTRRLSVTAYWRIQHILDRVALIPGEPVRPALAHPRAKAQLGWQPSVDFKWLMTMMVDADLKRYEIQDLQS